MPAVIDTAVRVAVLDDSAAEQREMVSNDGNKEPVTEASSSSCLLVSREERELNGEIREEAAATAEYSNQEISTSITNKKEKPQPVTPEALRGGGERSLESDKERWNTIRKNGEQQLKGSASKNDDDDVIDDDCPPDLIDEDSPRPTNSSSSQGNRKTREKYDDASSSDDDSYFATHLPAPNSSRSFSFTSTGSVHATTSSFYQNSARESDASLSFSDESDDDDDDMMQRGGVHISPMLPPKGKLSDLHLFNQRIMRMHSVSSLVSSTSEESPTEPKIVRTSSTGSVSSQNTSGTSSESSPRVELNDATSTSDSLPATGQPTETSGRRSPVMGQNAFPSYLQQSPPTILQGYAPPLGMVYPHAQLMPHEQMNAWMTANNPAGTPRQQPQNYGSTELFQHGLLFDGSTYQQVGSLHSVGDAQKLSFDVAEVPLVNQMANGLTSGPGITNRGATSNQGGYDPSRQQWPLQSESHGGYPIGGGGGFAPKMVKTSTGGIDDGMMNSPTGAGEEKGFKVYWQRWIMLLYMSVLNLLSDWTCYSVAPIALLTEEAFGNIDPERLVVVFLGANAVASACEPIILARLGLRRTVLFGALLLMIGSLVKSGGGMPPIIPNDLKMGHDEWRLYLGFFLVGLSQPLYQCTPALLSASWFPEKERTMATGVALNANQLGIGFAFIFGTLLVDEPDDILDYFGLLSLISAIVFLGTLIQFEDAPPTPPSSSAKVMRGSLEVNLPSIDAIVQSVRGLGGGDRENQASNVERTGTAPSPSPAASYSGSHTGRQNSSEQESGKARKRKGGSRSQASSSGLLAPSPARSGRTAGVLAEIEILRRQAASVGSNAPSPAVPGRVGQANVQTNDQDEENSSSLHPEAQTDHEQPNNPVHMSEHQSSQGQQDFQGGMVPPFGAFPPPQYQYPFWDPQVQQQMQQQHAAYQHQYYYYQQPPQAPPPYYYPSHYPNYLQGYDWQNTTLPAADSMDEGAEPTVTITPNHLDIDIRDDQVLLSIRACLARAGFVHALVAFTVSGIVINTLSTYMDYLVRLNGAPKYYTGIVGGTFQFVIMISSLIIGKKTDKTRAYYSVTIGMLVLGAFGLAECGVSLDENNGRDLRWSLVIVAALVGPLQPVSTELGVDVAYPLSENTVLVIQQLFSNLLSAVFIPVFKALKDIGAGDVDERPEYTFSFYLLIVLHTAATVFFATFNGKYLRYEHELEKKADEERQVLQRNQERYASHPFYANQQDYYDEPYEDERSPLVSPTI